WSLLRVVVQPTLKCEEHLLIALLRNTVDNACSARAAFSNAVDVAGLVLNQRAGRENASNEGIEAEQHRFFAGAVDLENDAAVEAARPGGGGSEQIACSVD